MLTVAVTGGIGSGKSTVSTALAELGAIVVDSDVLAREVVAPGTPGLAAIAAAFGADLIGADGALDRAGLAGIVFADPAARARLEGITHPLVRARAAQIQREAPVDAVVVNDIPILTTLAVAATFHLVVGVRAAEDVRVARLVGRGLAEPDARSRIASQITDDDLAPALRAAGFPVAAGFDRDNPHPAGADQRDWCKRLHQNADPGRSINLHLRVTDSAGWRWALLFRDWLTADPSVAADYLALKRSLAAAHAGEPTAAGYAEAKEPWMAAAYGRGMAWAVATGWRPAED